MFGKKKTNSTLFLVKMVALTKKKRLLASLSAWYGSHAWAVLSQILRLGLSFSQYSMFGKKKTNSTLFLVKMVALTKKKGYLRVCLLA
jgi:hypothetical protein